MEKTYTKESETEVRISKTEHEVVSLASLYESKKHAEERLQAEVSSRDTSIANIQAEIDILNEAITEAESVGVKKEIIEEKTKESLMESE
jgi:chromosome segregation ATPase